MSDLKDIVQELSDQDGWDGSVTLKLSSLSAGVRRAYGTLHGTPDLEIDWDVLESLVGMNATISTLIMTALPATASMDATIQTLLDKLPISTTELSAYIISLLDSVPATVGMGSTVGVISPETLATNAGMGATISWAQTLPVNEELVLTDDCGGTFIALVEEFLETLFLYEEIKTGWHLTNDETLGLADDISYILGLIINEWLTLVDTQTNNWNGKEIVSESLSLYDLAIAAQNYSKTVDDTLGIADNVSYMLTVTVLELLGFTDLANAMKSITESVNESIDLTDSATRGFSLSIADTLDIVDAHSVIALFLHTVQDTLGVEDTATLIKRLGITVNDPLVLTDTVSSQGTFYTAVYDTLGLNVTVELAGEIWECYVLNTPKFYPSMYSGFDFNSFCVFEGRAFGANDTGVYELTGTTDAGATIHTGIILNDTDFGSPNQKRFRRGYLGISGAAPVMVLETEDGLREVYSIDDQGKTVFSSDQKSKSWKLSVADFNTLSSIKLLPVILTK